MPMYYQYDCDEAYKAKNEYIFGGQLLVCPITKPADKRLNLSSADVWLPEGKWTDIFNGRKYEGGQWVTMYRDLNSIPVLAAEGSIVPMYHSAYSNCLTLDQPLDIHIWHGTGHFTLYEDDGETNAYQKEVYAITEFSSETTASELRLTIQPPTNSYKLLPEYRTMNLLFRDIAYAECEINGATHPFSESIPVSIGCESATILLKNLQLKKNTNEEDFKINLLTRVQGSNKWKSKCFSESKKIPTFIQKALSEFDTLY